MLLKPCNTIRAEGEFRNDARFNIFLILFCNKETVGNNTVFKNFTAPYRLKAKFTRIIGSAS